MTATRPVVLWLRRDLRLLDHPALLAAASSGAPVVPLFVIDPALWDASGAPRRDRLAASLRSLAEDLHERYAVRLVIRRGSPDRVVPDLAAKLGATAVHVTAETTPYGRRRDAVVAAALAQAGVEWRATGTAYAVGPGTILTGGGTPYRVFTPFSRAWRAHGAPGPAPLPTHLTGLADVPFGPLARRPSRTRRPGGRRGSQPRTVALVLGRGAHGIPGSSRPTRPRWHLAAVRSAQVRRDPPAHSPGRSRHLRGVRL
ncbi:MAG: deoxyribodipyrimidine photo-lyase [Dermatophilaceae bacterium]